MTITLTNSKGHFLSPTFITLLAQQIFIEYLLGAGENAVNNTMKISAFRDVMYSMEMGPDEYEEMEEEEEEEEEEDDDDSADMDESDDDEEERQRRVFDVPIRRRRCSRLF